MISAATIETAGGEVPAAVCNGAQRLCDVVGELPFAIVHRHGNARLDHSCVVVSAKADARMPVAITWEAVGEFEHERWQAAKMPAGAAANNPLFGGTLAVEVDHLFATTDASLGMPRPAMVEKMGLLLDTGYAIRAIVPANSKLFLAMAPMQLPPALGAELRITFGDPCVIVLVVEGRDEEAAGAWLTKGKELLAQGKTTVDAGLPEPLQQSKELRQLLDALFAASFCTKGNAAFATVEIKGFTSTTLRAMVEAIR